MQRNAFGNRTGIDWTQGWPVSKSLTLPNPVAKTNIVKLYDVERLKEKCNFVDECTYDTKKTNLLIN
jgi:hypothetical protein